MASVPPETILPRELSAPTNTATEELIETGWMTMHRQANHVARLAEISAEAVVPELSDLLARAQPWQRNLAAQGIVDVSEMLASGLAALATLSERGQDTAAPALALWKEFHATRAAILGVLHIDPVA